MRYIIATAPALEGQARYELARELAERDRLSDAVVELKRVREGSGAKELHALASAVKLVCSETAGRVADAAVQIHGGRGYMREQPVERLWREVRVDRIWEGTS